MNYIELCSGMGGTRIGLNKARWNCLFAADKDPAAVEIYNAVWGHSRCMDISAIISSQLPNYDALVAGFPCQPFSSAGPRFGFDHGEGNVFEHIVRIIADTGPKVILLENVRGLLVHNQGRTFSTVLQSLVQLGYDVIWYLTDLKTLGVPHSRPRIIIVAVDPVHRLDPESVFPWIAKKHSSSVSTIIEQKLPPISKFQKFTTMGKVSGDRLWSADIVPGKYDFDPADLGSIVAPKFQFPEVVHSVRFYARGKGTKPSFRRNGIAHCVGNVPGGAPLFSAPLKYMHQISLDISPSNNGVSTGFMNFLY